MTAQQMASPSTDKTAPYTGEWQVVLNSIGSGGASIIGVLKQITDVSEIAIAARLFQAPSILFKNLSHDIAQKAVIALRQAGLECDLQTKESPFTPGDADHEVALVIRDFSRMASILESVSTLLGVDLTEARNILYATPTVLLGQISAATVTALQNRFEPLGVEVDVSRPKTARFDMFLGKSTLEDTNQVIKIITNLGFTPLLNDDNSPNSLLMTDLSLSDAQKIWEPLRRANLPVFVVNRDFERFDLRLEAAPAIPAMTQFLVETAGMPERIVPKVLQRLPIVTHSNISFTDLKRYLATIYEFGGKAVGELLAFQKFSLSIEQLGDPKASKQLVSALTQLSLTEADTALNQQKSIAGPLTNPQAHWLQFELKRVGTISKLVSR